MRKLVSLARAGVAGAFRKTGLSRRIKDTSSRADQSPGDDSTSFLQGSLLEQLPKTKKDYLAVFRRGGLGDFLYRTYWGWHVYVAALVFIVGACETGLVVLNRLLFMTGTWRFPYPVTTTFAQLVITHGLLLLSASLTRGLAWPLTYLGLTGLIAPSRSFMNSGKVPSPRALPGVAADGDLDQKALRPPRTWPVALPFALKVLLSNLTFAYTLLPKYTISRIHTVPATLILSGLVLGETHSISTWASASAAVIYLGMASNQPGIFIAWECVITAVISAFCTALYPIFFLKTFMTVSTQDSSQTNINGGRPGEMTMEPSHDKNTQYSAAAHWQLLYRLSLLSVLLCAPCLILSGEIFDIWRNCYILDQYKLWIPLVGSCLTSFGVFVATPLLLRATSPLTTTFLMIPRGAFQLAIFNAGMPSSCLVGIVSCYLSSVWYLLVRRSESVTLKRLRDS